MLENIENLIGVLAETKKEILKRGPQHRYRHVVFAPIPFQHLGEAGSRLLEENEGVSVEAKVEAIPIE